MMGQTWALSCIRPEAITREALEASRRLDVGYQVVLGPANVIERVLEVATPVLAWTQTTLKWTALGAAALAVIWLWPRRS